MRSASDKAEAFAFQLLEDLEVIRFDGEGLQVLVFTVHSAGTRVDLDVIGATGDDAPLETGERVAVGGGTMLP